MAFINKDNLHKVSPNDRRTDELEDALKYLDRSDGPPIAIVYYLTKDELNRAQVWSKMIKKQYDPANGVRTFRDDLEPIAKEKNFYKFLIPRKDNLSSLV